MIEIEGVPGLYLAENVITKKEQQSILKNLIYTEGSKLYHIHANATEFGWKFSNRKLGFNGKYTTDDYLGKHPEWLVNLWKNIIERTNMRDIIKNAKVPKEELTYDNFSFSPIKKIELMDNFNDINLDTFDHCIVNTYENNKTNYLVNHVDSFITWTNWVVGLSMGSDVYFHFEQLNEKKKVFIPKYSVYLMINDARYNYTHGFPLQEFNKCKRVSITFRNINSTILPEEIKKKVLENDNNNLQ